MAETTHDSGIERLDAFLAQARHARETLAASQAALDARNDGLNAWISSGGARLQAVSQAMGALLDTFSALHLETQGSLAALTHSAGVLADGRLHAVREALGSTRSRFASGQASTREVLEHADTEWDQEFGEAEASIDVLEAQVAELQEETERLFAELRARVASADAGLRQAAEEVLAAVDSSADYLAQGLDPYMTAAFSALDGHLQREATPFVLDGFAELNRSLARAFDEYDALIEAASQELIESTEPLLSEATRTSVRAQEGASVLLERAEEMGLKPLAEEASVHMRAMARGEDIASHYPPLVPQLATARDVAERVQELLEVLNPFG